MATVGLLRACSRGSRSLLLQARITPTCISSTLLPSSSMIVSKSFTASPAAMSSFPVPEYFRARRGPFTPEEKRGKGHMMLASTHWKVERFIALGMIATMPAALFVQGPIMDHLLTTFIYLHGFWGIDGVLKDYLVKFIPWVSKVWYVIAILGFAGLVNFNFNDVGVCKAIQMFWAL